MQTVCAHCYSPLPHRRQRTWCILCADCEQNWAAGAAPVRKRQLPIWESTLQSTRHEAQSL